MLSGDEKLGSIYNIDLRNKYKDNAICSVMRSKKWGKNDIFASDIDIKVVNMLLDEMLSTVSANLVVR